jgi:glutaredoxin
MSTDAERDPDRPAADDELERLRSLEPAAATDGILSSVDELDDAFGAALLASTTDEDTTEEETVADDLIVYCRSWCGDCRRAKLWLEDRGIPYVEIDIEAQPEYAARVREIAGKIVTPTFEKGDQTCVDFDPARLTLLLARPE